MEIGCRNKLVTEFSDGTKGRIFIVKRKTWNKGTMTLAMKRNNIYIIGQPKVFRELLKNHLRRIQFLHELGHINQLKNGVHFIDENMATIVGFFRYKALFDSTRKLKVRHLWAFLKNNLDYTLYGNK